jgi:hypothetical protein
MINYYYIYYIDKTTEISKEQHLYILNNIIKKYSYPWCNSINNVLTEKEKNNICTDEFNFIKQKLYEYNPTIIIKQIPRIIYDLYIIYLVGEPDLVGESSVPKYHITMNKLYINDSKKDHKDNMDNKNDKYYDDKMKDIKLVIYNNRDKVTKEISQDLEIIV